MKEDWLSFEVVEADQALVQHVAELALSSQLRGLDALHLAAALVLPSKDVTVATSDTRLHHAARGHGLQTLPAALG